MATSPQAVIGVLGGMGPYAGLDLVQKVFDETQAGTDQEHLPVALLSYSHRIQDRSEYIFGRTSNNPATAIADVARDLHRLGARVAGIPCNSAHAPPIYDVLCDDLRRSDHEIRILHMIRETVGYARRAKPNLRRIGPISTFAVHSLGLYRNAIEAEGFEAVLPDDEVAEQMVNRAIFDPDFGIKSHSRPVTMEARDLVLKAIDHLRDRGAEAVILGCTELPLAVTESLRSGVMLIDATRALARALIRETFPDRLAPLPGGL